MPPKQQQPTRKSTRIPQRLASTSQIGQKNKTQTGSQTRKEVEQVIATTKEKALILSKRKNYNSEIIGKFEDLLYQSSNAANSESLNQLTDGIVGFKEENQEQNLKDVKFNPNLTIMMTEFLLFALEYDFYASNERPKFEQPDILFRIIYQVTTKYFQSTGKTDQALHIDIATAASQLRNLGKFVAQFSIQTRSPVFKSVQFLISYFKNGFKFEANEKLLPASITKINEIQEIDFNDFLYKAAVRSKENPGDDAFDKYQFSILLYFLYHNLGFWAKEHPGVIETVLRYIEHIFQKKLAFLRSKEETSNTRIHFFVLKSCQQLCEYFEILFLNTRVPIDAYMVPLVLQSLSFIYKLYSNRIFTWDEFATQTRSLQNPEVLPFNIDNDSNTLTQTYYNNLRLKIPLNRGLSYTYIIPLSEGELLETQGTNEEKIVKSKTKKTVSFSEEPPKVIPKTTIEITEPEVNQETSQDIVFADQVMKRLNIATLPFIPIQQTVAEFNIRRPISSTTETQSSKTQETATESESSHVQETSELKSFNKNNSNGSDSSDDDESEQLSESFNLQDIESLLEASSTEKETETTKTNLDEFSVTVGGIDQSLLGQPDETFTIPGASDSFSQLNIFTDLPTTNIVENKLERIRELLLKPNPPDNTVLNDLLREIQSMTDDDEENISLNRQIIAEFFIFILNNDILFQNSKDANFHIFSKFFGMLYVFDYNIILHDIQQVLYACALLLKTAGELNRSLNYHFKEESALTLNYDELIDAFENQKVDLNTRDRLLSGFQKQYQNQINKQVYVGTKLDYLERIINKVNQQEENPVSIEAGLKLINVAQRLTYYLEETQLFDLFMGIAKFVLTVLQIAPLINDDIEFDDYAKKYHNEAFQIYKQFAFKYNLPITSNTVSSTSKKRKSQEPPLESSKSPKSQLTLNQTNRSLKRKGNSDLLEDVETITTKDIEASSSSSSKKTREEQTLPSSDIYLNDQQQSLEIIVENIEPESQNNNKTGLTGVSRNGKLYTDYNQVSSIIHNARRKTEIDPSLVPKYDKSSSFTVRIENEVDSFLDENRMLPMTNFQPLTQNLNNIITTYGFIFNGQRYINVYSQKYGWFGDCRDDSDLEQRSKKQRLWVGENGMFVGPMNKKDFNLMKTLLIAFSKLENSIVPNSSFYRNGEEAYILFDLPNQRNYYISTNANNKTSARQRFIYNGAPPHAGPIESSRQEEIQQAKKTKTVTPVYKNEFNERFWALLPSVGLDYLVKPIMFPKQNSEPNRSIPSNTTFFERDSNLSFKFRATLKQREQITQYCMMHFILTGIRPSFEWTMFSYRTGGIDGGLVSSNSSNKNYGVTEDVEKMFAIPDIWTTEHRRDEFETLIASNAYRGVFDTYYQTALFKEFNQPTPIRNNIESRDNRIDYSQAIEVKLYNEHIYEYNQKSENFVACFLPIAGATEDKPIPNYDKWIQEQRTNLQIVYDTLKTWKQDSLQTNFDEDFTESLSTRVTNSAVTIYALIELIRSNYRSRFKIYQADRNSIERNEEETLIKRDVETTKEYKQCMQRCYLCYNFLYWLRRTDKEQNPNSNQRDVVEALTASQTMGLMLNGIKTNLGDEE